MSKHEPDPINEVSKIQKELSSFGIELLRPHLNKSSMDFEIEGNNIRFGLLSIKGVSDKTMEKITQFRKTYANKFDTFESAKQAGVNIGILSSLIQAGALDGFKDSRSFVVYEAQLWNQLTEKEKSYCMDMAQEHNFELVNILRELKDKKNEKGKLLIRESRFTTIRDRSEPYKKIYEQNKKSESFANWYYENYLLGYTCGTKLKEIFDPLTPDLIYINDVIEGDTEMNCKIIGKIFEKPKTGTSKKGNKYLKFQLKDETGLINVMIFTQNYENWKENNGGKNPQEGDIVIVKGKKKDRDTIFAESYHIQNNKVYTKLSDLKDKND
jgi:DNA polymerase III alpha subunit